MRVQVILPGQATDLPDWIGSPQKDPQSNGSTGESQVSQAQCAEARTAVMGSKCGDILKFQGRLYSCQSATQSCGASQSPGVYCEAMNPNYPQWGPLAWKDLGECP